MSRYPFNLGLHQFREEVAAWMGRRFGVEVDPAQELVPLIGSKDGIAHLPLGLPQPRGGGAHPRPGYQPYRGGVWLAGGDPILVPLRRENGFPDAPGRAPPEDVARSKLLYLNYPNNPTTAIASEGLPAVRPWSSAIATSLVLVYDNAYSEMAFDGYRPPSILEIDGGREVSLEFHSFSKTFNMTGWRLGWAVGNAELVAILAKVKSFMDTGAFLGIQAAGAAALRILGRMGAGEHRHLPAEAGRCGGGSGRPRDSRSSVPRQPCISGSPSQRRRRAMDFCRRALEQEGVIVLPGSSMGKGGEGFFRVALTTSEERLREAAARLGRLLA